MKKRSITNTYNNIQLLAIYFPALKRKMDFIKSNINIILLENSAFNVFYHWVIFYLPLHLQHSFQKNIALIYSLNIGDNRSLKSLNPFVWSFFWDIECTEFKLKLHAENIVGTYCYCYIQ